MGMEWAQYAGVMAARLLATITVAAVIGAPVSSNAEQYPSKPFAEDQNQLLKKFLEDSDFTVTAVKSLSLPVIDIGAMPAYQSYQLAKEAFRAAPNADAVYMPCAQMPTFNNIGPLEADLGVPVVTSFQAMLWHVFDMLDLREPVTGYGRLFHTLQR